MSFEHDFYGSQAEDLCRYLDEETLYLSGGFQHEPGFQDIIELGENALPTLFQLPYQYFDEVDFEMTHPWRLYAIQIIAQNIEKPITFTEEAKHSYIVVKKQVAQWGLEHGFIHEISRAWESNT